MPNVKLDRAFTYCTMFKFQVSKSFFHEKQNVTVTFSVRCGGHTENAHKVPYLTKYCLEVVDFDLYTNKIATMTLI